MEEVLLHYNYIDTFSHKLPVFSSLILISNIQEINVVFIIIKLPHLTFYDGPDIKLFILVGWDRSFLSVAWPTGVKLVFFFFSGVSKLFGAQGSPSSGSLLNL